MNLRFALPLLFACLGGASLAWSGTASGAQPDEIALDPHGWRIIPSQSGKVDYYRVVSGEEAHPFIRAEYKPGYDTAVFGYKLADEDRDKARTLRWSWRAQKLPAGGNECDPAKSDSAAVVYISWRRGVRYYTIKYTWSAAGQKGSTCERKRNPFVAQDTMIVESGGPIGEWRTVNLDLAAEFRNHFEGGDPKAAVPEFLGVAIMSDGDQTKTESSADYGNFVVGL